MLLLLGDEMSVNPGPFMFVVLNAGSTRNKGPPLADTMASHGFLLSLLH